MTTAPYNYSYIFKYIIIGKYLVIHICKKYSTIYKYFRKYVVQYNVA